MAKPKRKINKEIFIENIPEGYRVSCEACGKIEIIPVNKEGMPVEAFWAWSKSIQDGHKYCKKIAAADAGKVE